MPIFMKCSRGSRVQLGDYAGVSWERANQNIRWTIDTTTTVTAGSITIQPSESLIAFDVPLGHKIQIGPAVVWVEYVRDTDDFSMKLECPRTLKITPTKQQMYLAKRSGGKMVIPRPVPTENGHVPAQTATQ